MALLKPFVMYNNPPYSGGSLRVLREDDFIKADVIQRDPHPLNKTFLGRYGIISMPETLILGKGSFLHEGILYEGKNSRIHFDVSIPTFSRYTAEHLKQIHLYYNIIININYFIFFDKSDDPGPIINIISPRKGRFVEWKVKLNNPPSHLKSVPYRMGIAENLKREMESDKFQYEGKTYKKYPTHSDIIMIDTDSEDVFDKNTLAYKLICCIQSLKNLDKDLHPNLYYQYEIIAHKYRDYV